MWRVGCCAVLGASATPRPCSAYSAISAVNSVHRARHRSAARQAICARAVTAQARRHRADGLSHHPRTSTIDPFPPPLEPRAHTTRADGLPRDSACRPPSPALPSSKSRDRTDHPDDQTDKPDGRTRRSSCRHNAPDGSAHQMPVRTGKTEPGTATAQKRLRRVYASMRGVHVRLMIPHARQQCASSSGS